MRLVGAFLVALAVLLPSAALAAEAKITVEAAHPLDPVSVHYYVRVTGGDGRPVEGATVRATASGPDGALLPATRLDADPAEPGVYQGPLRFPEQGVWNIRFSTAQPAASVRYEQDLSAGTGSTVGEESGGSGVGVAVAVGLGLLVVLIAGAALWTRSRRRQPEAAASAPPS